MSKPIFCGNCVPHNHGTSGTCPPGCEATVMDCKICEGVGFLYPVGGGFFSWKQRVAHQNRMSKVHRILCELFDRERKLPCEIPSNEILDAMDEAIRALEEGTNGKQEDAED